VLLKSSLLFGIQEQTTLYADFTSRYSWKDLAAQLGSACITVNKTIRILGISLALIALMIFATGVVSDWNHQGPSDDAHCPYCHLGHQTPAQLVVAPAVSLLKPVASLPLPENIVPAAGPVFSQTAPRAPPV